MLLNNALSKSGEKRFHNQTLKMAHEYVIVSSKKREKSSLLCKEHKTARCLSVNNIKMMQTNKEIGVLFSVC